jgi:excisionase family DNA binding protein
MQNTDTDARPEAQPDRLAYSVDAFAELVGIGRTKVYAEIRDGRLRAKKLGTRTLIPGSAAHAYLDSLPDVKAAA